MVRIAPPPPTVVPQPLFYTINAGVQLVRIFNPISPIGPIGPVAFNHYGPRHRFDHHRLPPTGITSPWNDPDRSIYYAGWTLSCCIAECFGDTLLIDNPDCYIACSIVTRPLRLLDLCGNGAMRIGSVAALGGTADRILTQEWSRYIYDEPVFVHCDGIRFHNAHNNEEAVALYERSIDALDCAADQIIALADPLLRPVIEDIAIQLGMTLLI